MHARRGTMSGRSLKACAGASGGVKTSKAKGQSGLREQRKAARKMELAVGEEYGQS